MDAVDLIERQHNAYNRRDLLAFCECFSEDIQVIEFESEKILLEGKSAFEAAFGKRFKSRNLQSKLIHRADLGNLIVDHEVVEGINPIPISAVVIYSVENLKIVRMTTILSKINS